MRYTEWENSLLVHLETLPADERNKAAEYYREMLSDRLDAGVAEENILRAFGDPQICAAKIILESKDANSAKDYGKNEINAPKKSDSTETVGLESINNDKKIKEAVPVQNKSDKKFCSSRISVSKIIGWFFITTLILIPLAASVISVIAAFASVAIAGGACMLGGAIIVVASPITFAFGSNLAGVLCTAGAGSAVAGIGALVLLCFYTITKYCVISCYKIIKYATRRRA